MGFTPMEQGYKLVSERHTQFVADNPKGLVKTEMVSHNATPVQIEGGFGLVGYVIMKCEVWRDRADADDGKQPDGVGHAGLSIPGITNFTRGSEVENAETSALGRALAAIGYHAKDSMASEDEIAIKKTETTTRKRKAKADEVEAAVEEEVTSADRAMLMNWGKRIFGDRDAVLAFLKKEFNISSGKDITPDMLPKIKELFAIHEATQKSNA